MDKKSKDPSQAHKKVSRSVQTDFSLSAFEEKLLEKDRKIDHLEKQLLKYKSHLLLISQKANLEATPSINNLISNAAESPTSKGRLLISSINFEENSSLFTQLHSKLPLDTANIEEIDKLILKQKGLKIVAEPQRASSKFSLKHTKKPLPPMSYKSSIVRRSKMSLKSKSRLQKESSVISELLFQDETDKEAWSQVMNKFRNDPNLLSQALRDTGNKEGYSASVEPPQRARVSSAYKTRKLSQGFQHETRPISASVVKSGRHYRPVTAKVHEIDWSKSVLDSNFEQGTLQFKTEDNYLGNDTVEEILQDKNWEKFIGVYEKAAKTVEKLKFELMIPSSYMIVPPKSIESFESLLNNCASLFKARALVIKILKTIHLREDSFLRLIASDNNGSNKEFEVLQKLSQEIIQNILFLKHTKFPIGNFIYLGEDYCVKIQRDNDSILSLMPNLKPYELYEGSNL